MTDPSASIVTSPRASLLPWAPARVGDPADAAPRVPELRCILALGAALLSYGLPAHRIEESILRLARAFGCKVSVFGLPTAAIIAAPDLEPGMFVARAVPGAIDLSRLDALHNLVARVERKELEPAQAEQQVAAILNGRRRYPRWVDLPAVALVAFGGALMLGTSARDASWSGLLGLFIGVLLWLSASHPALSRVAPVIGTVLVTLASCALAHAAWVDHPLVITMGALLVLLPGLTLTLAMTELATGHLVSGGARTVAAAGVFLQLGFGVLLGMRLGRLDQAELAVLEPAALGPASSGALVLAIGFAALHVVRARDLGFTLLVSALAFFVCRLTGARLGAEIGVLIAATAVGLFGHAFARYRDRPSSTLTLPGVVMLVPGSLGLIAVSAAALHDPSRALDIGFQMLMTMIALSTGILISTAALPPRTAL
jgi:uncharacterized membrane protein YjjP (DUF1212 family)